MYTLTQVPLQQHQIEVLAVLFWINLKLLKISHHLSFVHYNVQSILTKLDLLTADLADFDILAFSETWLRPEVLTDSKLLPSFFKPERKDPQGDVTIYVKDNIIYTRRHDLELPGIECIWNEIILKQKRLLFGLFYRPNSDQIYHSAVEDSIHLAVHTGIKAIVVKVILIITC